MFLSVYRLNLSLSIISDRQEGYTVRPSKCPLLLFSSILEYLDSGPAFFESHAVFPETTRVVVDVNLGNNSVDIAHDQIKASIAHLGWNKIYSLQRKVAISPRIPSI